MIWTIYFIIFTYFVLGGISFFFINRKKSAADAKKNWTKFITYFFIIHILFFSIVFNSLFFRFFCVIIIAVGFFELLKLFMEAGFTYKTFFLFSLILFSLLAGGLYIFSGMEKGLILFSFLILSIFDSFSQISGQLFGRKKLFPKISPQKTFEGLIGGAITALISAFLLKTLTGLPPLETVFLAAGIVVFAFAGDVLASYYKRKYGAKDFSRLIPGHGGFLDRFDSLIAGGAWIGFVELLMNL